MIVFADCQTTDMADSFGLHPYYQTDLLQYCLGVKPGVVQTVRPYEGIALPDLLDPNIDAIIIGGSAFMVDDGLPWQPAFEAWVAQIIALQVPLFAYCYGHQTVARVLKGKTGVDPNGRNFGITRITRTSAGKKHYILKGVDDNFVLPVSHLQSVLEPPQGAALLAEQSIHPSYLLAYNDRLITIQAEIAYDRPWIQGLLRTRKERYLAEGFITSEDDAHELLHTINTHIIEASRNGQIIARNFLHGAVSGYMQQQGRDLNSLLVAPRMH